MRFTGHLNLQCLVQDLLDLWLEAHILSQWANGDLSEAIPKEKDIAFPCFSTAVPSGAQSRSKHIQIVPDLELHGLAWSSPGMSWW